MTGGQSRRAGRSFLLVLAALMLAQAGGSGEGPHAFAAEPDGRWALLVAGISGDPRLRDEHAGVLRSMRDILTGELRFRPDQVLLLCDDPSKAPDLAARRSTRENLAQACSEIAVRATKDSLVLVFFIGHGSSDGTGYKLNLVGPDPDAGELGKMLDPIAAGTLVVVNATSASGASVGALSGENRIIISATKSGSERNLTRMPGFFVEALRQNAADTDKNGRVSLLEAFQFTSRRVQEHFAREGSLQTEHPVLDDNGDGTGHDLPAPDNGDGLLARTTDLAPVAGANASSGAPEAALARDAAELQRQIEALKYSKERLTEAEYRKRLEELLIRLAQIHAKLGKN
jgi:hypothetical protein